MRRKIAVKPSFFLILLCAFAAAPARLVACILLAAAAHEAGHLALLAAFGVKIERITLAAMGAEICAPKAARLSYGRELAVTLAGVAVNALLALTAGMAGVRLRAETLLLFAGANAVLGAYNLLPIPPLDGGHALYLITAYFFGPTVGDAVTAVVGTLCAIAAVLLGGYAAFFLHGGYFFLLAAHGLLFGAISQLGLAKSAVRV